MALRTLRRIAIGLLALGIAFVALNVWGERIAERRLSQAIADRFDLSDAPTVDLQVFPIITTIMRGRLAGLSVRATNLVIEELEVRTLEISLTGVGVDAGGILGGAALSVTVEEGSIRARINQAAINRYLRARGEDAKVSVSPGQVRVTGSAAFAGGTFDYDARGRLRLNRRTLRFIAEDVLIDGRQPPGPLMAEARRQAGFRVEIPALPGGFVADRISAHPRFLRLSALLENATVDFSNAG